MGSRSYFTYKGWECAESGFADRAIAELTKHHVGSFSLESAQLYAWQQELAVLRQVALAYPECTIALEYMIPRMGKRVDAMVLVGDYIFVVEFKVGECSYPAHAVDQVADYAFDLKNFHGESHDRALFPILVCTEARDKLVRPSNVFNGICNVQYANRRNLLDVIEGTMRCARLSSAPLDHGAWLSASYHPTPTIVEAAQALYQHNTVDDISRNEAGVTNIMATTECVNTIIDFSRANKRKSICFITGVPGAGKTLVGLNIACTRRSVDVIHELAPALRTSSQAEAFRIALQMLGDLTGFGIQYFDFDNAGYVKTATEVSSDNSQLMRNIARHEHALEQSIAGICRSLMSAYRGLGESIPDEGSVCVDFDDSIVTDTAAEKRLVMSEVGVTMHPWEYRMRFYGESEEEARRLAEGLDVKRSAGVGA